MKSLQHIVTVIACCLAGCGSNPGEATANDNHPDTIAEPSAVLVTRTKTVAAATNESVFTQRLVDTIFNLPEVIAQSKYIKEQTKGARRLKVWIDAVPHQPDQPFYCLKAGEDNGDALVTHLNFCIDPVTLEIFYYDPISDSTQTLASWRRSVNK